MGFFNVRVLPINLFHLAAEFQPSQRGFKCVEALKLNVRYGVDLSPQPTHAR